MYRARWGRLSGVGTSWTLLAASVLVVASSLSRGQAGGGVRGWSSGRLVPMPAGRGHGQHAAQEWARVHWCKCRMRHLRAKEAAGSESVGSRNMLARMHVRGWSASCVATWRRTVSAAAQRLWVGWRGAACSRAGETAERRGGLGRHLGETTLGCVSEAPLEDTCPVANGRTYDQMRAALIGDAISGHILLQPGCDPAVWTVFAKRRKNRPLLPDR